MSDRGKMKKRMGQGGNPLCCIPGYTGLTHNSDKEYMMRIARTPLICLVVVLLLASCSSAPASTPAPEPTPTATPVGRWGVYTEVIASPQEMDSTGEKEIRGGAINALAFGLIVNPIWENGERENALYELRIEQTILEVERCDYVEDVTATSPGPILTITFRATRTATLTLTDLQNGVSLGSESFDSGFPKECPDTRKVYNGVARTMYIENPLPISSVRSWVVTTLTEKGKGLPGLTQTP